MWGWGIDSCWFVETAMKSLVELYGLFCDCTMLKLFVVLKLSLELLSKQFCVDVRESDAITPDRVEMDEDIFG